MTGRLVSLAGALSAVFVAAGSALAAGVTLTAGHLTADSHAYGAAVTCTLSAAAADSYVAKELSGSNFGTQTTLIVSSAGVTTRRVFIGFDLAACSAAIPSTALVTSAKLRLTTATVALGTRTYDATGVTSSWTETGVTWTNQPSAASSVSSSTSVTLGAASGTVVEWSVIGDTQAFVTGSATNSGWRITDSAEGAAVGTLLTFDSREAASGRPQLVVTYVP